MFLRRALSIALIASAPALPLALLGSACSSEKPAPPAPQPIVIGVSLGLTGSLESTAAPLKNATKVAEVQINSLGGLFGRPVEFRIIDDTSDDGNVIKQRVTALLDQGAVALIGPGGSQQVKNIQEILSSRKIIQVASTATSPDLTAMQPSLDRYFFRTVPSDDLQGKAVVLFAASGPPGASADGGPPKLFCSKMAVVHIDNSYGNAMADVIGRFFPKRGGSIELDLPVSAKPADNNNAEVDQVIAAHPGCLVLIGYDDVGDAFMTDLKARTSELPANE